MNSCILEVFVKKFRDIATFGILVLGFPETQLKLRCFVTLHHNGLDIDTSIITACQCHLMPSAHTSNLAALVPD